MNDWTEIRGYAPSSWPLQRAREACDALERGHILFFPGVPFEFPPADREFLLSQQQAESRFHKNISYRPKQDELRGVSGDAQDRARVQQIMRSYSANVSAFIRTLLAPYANDLQLDFASYRPLEEQGRDLPKHRRNDLLHVDAFPTRPMWGNRILRVFTNINPIEPRAWRTGAPLHQLAPEFAEAAGLRRFAESSNSALGKITAMLTAGLHGMRLPVAHRSGYDRFMLHFHDWLKFNDDFQQRSGHQDFEFPPGSTWMVFTDGVPHAALSGRCALEQTFIVPRSSLVTPNVAPINVLEKLAGSPLA